jgi:hypothetical protein
MKFLREPALQGAGFLLTILVVLLDNPQHLMWLIPLSVCMILLLYVGYAYGDSTEKSIKGFRPANKEILLAKFAPIIKNWIVPIVTLIVIFVSGFLGLKNFYLLIFNKQIRAESNAWVEVVEIDYFEDTDSLCLKAYVTNPNLLYLFSLIDPEIVFFVTENESDVFVKFNDTQIEFEDSGIDRDNVIMEPIDRFEYSTNLNGNQEREFQLKSGHTYFVKMTTGNYVRVHIVSLIPISSRMRDIGQLVQRLSFKAYISYNGNHSARFENLLAP